MAEKQSNLFFRCQCGALLTATWRATPFKKGWKVEPCPKCHSKHKLENPNVIVCPHCKRVVLSRGKTCEACGKPIAGEAESVIVPCPSCHANVYLPQEHQGEAQCDICGTTLTQAYIRSRLAQSNKKAPPAVILLPDAKRLEEEGLIVAKHPASQFAYRSQAIVSEGTYALLLQNGACRAPLAPGSHLLEDSGLDKEDRFNVAMTETERDVVFNTDIYTVRKRLPPILWRARATVAEAKPREDRPARAYTVTIGGRIRYQVEDAKAFVDHCGFRQTTEQEVCGTGSNGEQLGWLKEKNNSIVRLIYEQVCRDVLSLPADRDGLDAVRTAFVDAMKRALDERVEAFGLYTASIDCDDFEIEETQESQRRGEEFGQSVEWRKEIESLAQTQFEWKAAGIEVHARDGLELKATLGFGGSCRLSVVDKTAFWDVPEHAAMLGQPLDDAARRAFVDRVRTVIARCIADAAQTFIDSGAIASPVDKTAYRQIEAEVKAAVGNALYPEGLSIQYFYMELPAIAPGQKLRDALEAQEREQKLRAYAERSMLLKTEPILIHMAQDATVYVKAAYQAQLRARVSDMRTFLATSQVQMFMKSSPFVTAQEVVAHYTDHIRPLFDAALREKAQVLVNQTQIDLRDLDQLNSALSEAVRWAIGERLSSLGMTLESLDMEAPRVMERSEGMVKWLRTSEKRTSTALDNEMTRMNSDQQIFEHSEADRVEDALKTLAQGKAQREADRLLERMDIDEKVDAKVDQQAQDKRARQHRAAMEEMRLSGERDRLQDELREDRKEREHAGEMREQQHRWAIEDDARRHGMQARREAQQFDIDTRTRAQQEQLDAMTREQSAKLRAELDTAENKRLLNEILHRIDESDLTWRQKLEEYERLRQRTAVSDAIEADAARADAQAKIDTTKSEAQQKIKREENETYLLVGETKIKLDRAQAELMESIAQYAEARGAREQERAAALRERELTLAFEQKMRERIAELDRQTEALRMQYEHELALRDRDDALAIAKNEMAKLQYTLDYLARRDETQAQTQRTGLSMMQAIETAKAQYQAEHERELAKQARERVERRDAQDEDAAKKAHELQMRLLEIAQALQTIQLGNERNRDDRLAEVAKAQGEQAQRGQLESIRSIVEGLEKQLNAREDKHNDEMRQMTKALGDMAAAIEKLKKRMKKPAAPAPVPQPSPVPTYAPQPSPVPTYAPQPSPVPTYAPQPSPVPTYAPQPGMGTKVCPNCGHVCSVHATVCENCKKPL